MLILVVLGGSIVANGARLQAVGPIVDMNRIAQIESSNNPNVGTNSVGATGLNQIRPIALKDYNNNNPNNQFTQDDLNNPDVNWHVGNWTYNKRIPQMLKIYGIPDTTENRIRTYHDGIGNVKNGKTSQVAKDYITKYNNLGAQNGNS